ncbi:winged helix-turn-helix transcriptional regulator, partial [Streptomyces europaeiscabiei]|uniref:winged helix-turn-helix transcriptional regulator n=1 Tax=Streptomyces europaeiscabiei TaxID=146819 RepID=UPI0029AC40B5
MSPRRSYDQYCSAARALDLVGDRWTLLIVRELLAGPRRYTDLHADLPGVSTDVLASRLKGMERDGLTTRRRLPPPGAAYVYELSARGLPFKTIPDPPNKQKNPIASCSLKKKKTKKRTQQAPEVTRAMRPGKSIGTT